MMRKYGFILLLLCLGCTFKKQPKALTVKLANNGHSLQITGLNNDITAEIGRDSNQTVWQTLIPVYRMPKDTDLKDYQTPQPGKYMVTDNAVIFTPDTPFVKQQFYFVRWYQYNAENSMMEFIQHRKKLGQVKFTDLSFER